MARTLSPLEIEEFKARLCAVAEARFAENGVAGVSMRQLADALGCSPMTPYRYFRDKDDILAAVRAAAFDRFALALEDAAATSGAPHTTAMAVSTAYIDFAEREPHAYRLMFDMQQSNGEQYPELMRAAARARATMGGNLRTEARLGRLAGDPEQLGLVSWAALHGLVMLRLAGKLPPRTAFDAIKNALLAVLARGMSKPEARTAAVADGRADEALEHGFGQVPHTLTTPTTNASTPRATKDAP